MGVGELGGKGVGEEVKSGEGEEVGDELALAVGWGVLVRVQARRKSRARARNFCGFMRLSPVGFKAGYALRANNSVMNDAGRQVKPVACVQGDFFA